MLEARNVAYAIQGRSVLNGVSCAFQKGKMYGIIGPNGVGKSTLLHLLSGVGETSNGQVLLNGKNIGSYPRKTLARMIAVLQQSGLPPVGFTVREVVAMGRYPYQNWLGSEEEDAELIVSGAIAAMGLEALQHRTMSELSGGERQRAALAKMMAQQPSILLLDEPTTYLDIGYQVQLLDTVREWQRGQELTVIAVMHDLNLASLYFDELVVLHEGAVIASGSPHEVLTSPIIERVYGTSISIVAHPQTGVPQVMLQPNT